MELLEHIFVILAYVAVIGFLINGLDDLFFDMGFLHFLWRGRKRPHVTLQELKLVPEQWIAVIVPAWQEGGVVNKMAEYASRICIYERYDIFIGVYPNDPETNQCVDRVSAVNPRIHKVVVPHPGPTSKADCLNWIFKAMRLNEVPGVREYKLIALHDAEDVLHPLVLKVYNYFVPREYDMGQVPVFPLELPVLTNWVGNTYVDDFAEAHTKDLFVRQYMGGVVPSAGVGTCFSRAALDRLAAENRDEPFIIGNLTEDYEVAIRLKRAGFRAGVLSVPVERVVRRKRRDGTPGRAETITEVIAIRESFPSRFTTAIRQRSRWIAGISFQTWEQTGWAGTLPTRYTLLRDRRAPLTHLINMIGYLILVFVLAQWLTRKTAWAETHYLRPLFNSQALLWKIAIVDTWLLAYRALQKMISVYSIYNLKQAIASVPRVVVGNLINFIATARALKMYLSHKLLGRPIVWLKTSHTFPAESELVEYTKTIEDLLVEEGLVTHDQIVQALRLDQSASAPLTLLRMGLLEEAQFTSIWSKHSGLPIKRIDAEEVPVMALERFAEAESLKYEAMPVAQVEQLVQVAFREPPNGLQLAEVSRRMRLAVQPFLAPPSNIAAARHRAYPRLLLPPSRLALYTDRFAEAIEPAQFQEALVEQERTGQTLPDILVERGLLDPTDARKLWAECLQCTAVDLPELGVHKESYYKVGPCFWWLHRMLPVDWDLVVTAFPPHPDAQKFISQKTGIELPKFGTPSSAGEAETTGTIGAPSSGREGMRKDGLRFAAELPRRLELIAEHRELEFDPDDVLIECLAGKNVLRKDQLPAINAIRQLTTDPASKWLVLQHFVSEEDLHETFLEICGLSVATGIHFPEAQRLASIVPPGAAAENGCYPLAMADTTIRFGLSQMPSPAFIRSLYTRLAGYGLSFQALSHADAQNLANRTVSEQQSAAK